MWTTRKIKETFIEYFEKHNHFNYPQSSVIPKNDPSLLFTNSGMVQFKDIFMGNEQINYNRAVNSQRCIRAGGKHNDLDDVGKDSYHHTFFEMLGSWSFNYDSNIETYSETYSETHDAYFKESAIDFAWDLLVNVYGLNPGQMYVTYFEGDNELNISADIQTKTLWEKYLPENRILPFGKKENFWQVDDIGNCGPCTEIHYDLLGLNPPELVNKDDPTLIEIWNLVFMQYYKDDKGTLINLPKKHVDTGMGLERIASILQKCTNYQIDIYKNIMSEIENMSGRIYEDKYNVNDPDKINTSFRIIADHIRTSIIIINDGIKPGPVGRNYVLRRIIRRAVMCGRKLGLNLFFLSDLSRKVLIHMIEEFEDIKYNADDIIETIKSEEVQFNKTISNGLRYFKREMKKDIKTEKLFMLYTTFGFPIDIIKILCEENNIPFDMIEFQKLMDKHIKISKN